MRGIRVPVDRHHPGRVLRVDCVDAIGAMHGDAFPTRGVADDGVTRHRLATRRDGGENSLFAAHEHSRRGLDLRDQRDGAKIAARRVEAQSHPHHDRMRREVAVSDRGQEIVDGREPVQVGDFEQLRAGKVGEADAVHAVQLFVEEVVALGDVLLAALALEPLADALLGRGALDEIQPVPAGPVRTLRGEDLDDLAVLQRVFEGHHAAVDLRADASVTDLGVDAVGEVDRRGARGQVDDVAARREDVDLVLEQVDLDRVEEGLSVPHLVLPLEQAAQPRQLLVEARVLATFLVSPVGGDAELGDTVHLVGADLDLDGLAGMRDDGRVQGLIAVRLGHGDVVLEPAWHRLPQRVHDPQHPVAVTHRLDLDPDRGEVVDLAEVLALAGHLLPDGVDVLRPARDVGLDANLLELAGEDLAQI